MEFDETEVKTPMRETASGFNIHAWNWTEPVEWINSLLSSSTRK